MIQLRLSYLFFFLIGLTSLSSLAQTPETFTSDGTFTVPPGVTEISIEAWGGGGRGGDAESSGPTGGGGSGAYSKSTLPVSSGQTYSIIVGNGGKLSRIDRTTVIVTDGEESKVTNPNDASDVKVLAKGGMSVSDIDDPDGASGGLVTGAVGNDVTSPGNGDNNASGTNSGAGGSAPNGGSGGVSVSTNSPGKKGGSPGGGGSGAASSDNTLRDGGNGGDGQVKITFTKFTFTQATTGDFNIDSNWNVSDVPTSNDNAVINNGVVSTIKNPNRVVVNLGLNTNSEVKLNGNDLEVRGNITNNSQFTGSGEVILNNPSANQELSGNGAYNNLKLNNGGEIDINGNINVTGNITNSSQLVRLNGNTFNVEGNITNNSKFTGDGKIILNGSATQQQLSGNGEYQNLKLNNTNGANVTDSTEITGILSANSGTLATNGKITMKCSFVGEPSTGDPKTTAQVGVIDSSADITGEVIVERCVPKSNRAFRYISSPVNTTGTINDNLQEGATTASAEPNPKPGYGTHITGGSTSLGFDATTTNNPSMFEWNEGLSEPAWEAVSNTNTNKMSVGDAYALMIRGSRATPLNSNTAVGPATTLRFTGNLAISSQQVASGNLSNTDGKYNLVANPYQAIVDAKSLLESTDAKDLSTNYIYVYDPTLGSQGGYATVDISKADPTSIPEDNNNINDVTNADENILPNQAFFVKTTDSNKDNTINPSLTFKETYKNVTANLVDTFSANDILSEIHINLMSQQADVLVDGVAASFDAKNKNTVTNADADKFWNYGGSESVALFNSDNYLSIEKRATPAANDTLQLYTYNYQADAYVWQIDMSNINREAVLVDSYLDTETPLNVDGETNIAFDVDSSIEESSDAFRFKIKFTNETLAIDEPEKTNFALYPNPASDFVNISFGSRSLSEAQITITDIQGRQIKTINKEEIVTNQIKINTSTLTQGVYFVRINADQVQHTAKLIVE